MGDGRPAALLQWRAGPNMWCSDFDELLQVGWVGHRPLVARLWPVCPQVGMGVLRKSLANGVRAQEKTKEERERERERGEKLTLADMWEGFLSDRFY